MKSDYEDKADLILAKLYEMGNEAFLTDLKVRTKLKANEFHNNLAILELEGFVHIKSAEKKSQTIVLIEGHTPSIIFKSNIEYVNNKPRHKPPSTRRKRQQDHTKRMLRIINELGRDASINALKNKLKIKTQLFQENIDQLVEKRIVEIIPGDGTKTTFVKIVGEEA